MFTLLYILISLYLFIQSNTATSRPINLTNSGTVTVSVTDFGATGDGVTYDTTSIQSAIDYVSASISSNSTGVISGEVTGGTVIFPAGKIFLTATIYLRSRVNLKVERSAKVLGGTQLTDYPVESRRWYVVLGENVSDVEISGGGVIDGQGGKFVEKVDKVKNVMVSWNKTGNCVGDECRPRLVGFIECRNVRVRDVRLVEPAYWCLHIVGCKNTSISDVSIYGDFDTPNNDGIDIEDSNNTVISRCIIDTGDDAICPKTYTSPLYNLTATDCWIRTKSSAIKLGSASWFDFKGLLFNNITIVDSHRGLALQIRDGGSVSDITFSNINISTRYYDPSWWGRAEPIYVTTCPRYANSKPGVISNLLFVNITADSENGVFLSGSKDGVLRNLKLMNVDVTYKRKTNYVDGLVDYRPGCQGLVNHSAAGIIMEHIDGLVIENVNMRWSDDIELMGWNNPLKFSPATVNNISVLSFHSELNKDQLIVTPRGLDY